MKGWVRVTVLLVLLSGPAGCELTEVDIAEVEDVVIVESLVQIDDDGPPRVIAFLHRTLREGQESFGRVPGAVVTVRRPADGLTVRLEEQDDAGLSACTLAEPVGAAGTCYVSPPLADGALRPGDRLTLSVDLPDGGRAESATTVPGDFALGVGPPRCSIAPDTTLELVWTASEGAWVYVSQTALFGLPRAFAARGIDFDADPLELLGLSVSAADTTIVFPSEFGIFDRTDLDPDVAVALQRGLPPETLGVVAVAAADRNYVNWQRGGSFNPSGLVLVPSVVGDATGMFGSVVVRRLSLLTDPPPPDVPGEPPCVGV